MSKTMKFIMAGLSLLAVDTMVVGPARAAGPTAINPKSGVNLPRATFTKLVNGSVHVGTRCSGEFPDYDRTMKFFDRPEKICVRWMDREPVASATWELWKDKATGADEKIASGAITAAKLGGGTHSTFDIVLKSEVPLHNTGSADQKYFVKVVSKKTADAKAMVSGRGTLVHRPKASEPGPQPIDPYKCAAAPDKYRRLVQLMVPQMTVQQTTSTSGDGDRDEVYFKIDRLGPSDHGSARLPGNDDYYEAHQGEEYKKTWTNKDQKNKARPTLWQGHLKHGQIVDLGVAVMEQDNSDLANIKNQITEAMLKVEQAALATNNPYGAIVAAAAGLVALHASLIPNTNGHDFIGNVIVRAENKCGHIRVTWTTFPKVTIPGVGTLYNDFVDSISHDKLEGRVVVLSRPAEGFSSGDPVDWGGYVPSGLSDSFWWSAKGTSNSKYMFTLKARTFTQKEEEAIQAALDKLP